MRKTRAFLIAVSLLLFASATTQAADVAISTNPATGRAGGGSEPANGIRLSISQEALGGGSRITLRFTADLSVASSAITATDQGGTDLMDDAFTATVSGSTLTFTLAAATTIAPMQSITIGGVRLNLIGEEEEVSVTMSLSGSNFISGDATHPIIAPILEPLVIDAAAASGAQKGRIDPTGGTDEAAVVIKEGFAAAFGETQGMDSDEGQLRLQILNIPLGTKLEVGMGAGTMLGTAEMAGTVMVDGQPLVAAVAAADDKPAIPAEMLVLTVTEAGPINLDIQFDNLSSTTKEVLVLALKLTADPADGENEDLVLPVVGPDALARVTMWPTNKNDTPYFARNYLPAGGQVVFTFAAAQCKRLFPYVTNAMEYDTGLAITNATASTENPVDGTILFTLFPNHAKDFKYRTDAGSPRGNGGLDNAGVLPAGNTYALMLSELLAETGWDEKFYGHIVVQTNFALCSGLGWITDFSTVNQAYIATEMD
jgi:hypothetical protein